jgi:RNA polymerase sigma-70 factor, ECF subfamily
MTDEQLVSRCIDGDQIAFNDLVRRLHKPLYNFVLRYMSDPDDAMEITQKTWIKAYQKLHTLEDPSRFNAWLYRIALNQCRDEARRTARSSLTSIDRPARTDGPALIDLYQSKAADPEQHLTSRERDQLIHHALSLLPEEQRSVVVMKELQGLRFTEIADALNIPVNTAKTRMYNGLRALGKIFNGLNLDKEMINYGS